MTVPSETNRSGPYNGNGSTTVFDYQFRIVDEDHLKVIKTSALGVETVLIIDTDYVVSDVGEAAGGQVACTVAPAVGETITILRNVPFVQETDLENQGAYYAETVEDALDLAAMRDQQLSEEIERAVRVPASIATGTDLQLPAPEAGKIIAWNETADGLQNLSPEELSSVVAYGTANADIFTGDGVQTVFALSANPAAINNLDVAIGGVTQLPGTDYTWTSGTNITFTTAPENGVKILVRYMQALAQGVTEDELVTSDDGASGSLWSNLKGFITYIRSSAGSAIIGFSHALSYAVGSVGAKLRQSINPLDAPYGATGGGVVDDRAALFAADAAGPIVITANHRVSSNITFTKPVLFAGDGRLTIDSGVTVTFSFQPSAPLHQIFYDLGSVAGLAKSWLDWFAGSARSNSTPSTECRARVQLWLDSVVNNGDLRALPGHYLIDGSSPLNVTKGQNFTGPGEWQLFFHWQGSVTNGFHFLSSGIDKANFSGFQFRPNVSGTIPTAGIAINFLKSYTRVEDFIIIDAYDGIDNASTVVTYISNYQVLGSRNAGKRLSGSVLDYHDDKFIIQALYDWITLSSVSGVISAGDAFTLSSGQTGTITEKYSATTYRARFVGQKPVAGATLTDTTSGATATLAAITIGHDQGGVVILDNAEAVTMRAGDVLGGRRGLVTFTSGVQPRSGFCFSAMESVYFDSSYEGSTLTGAYGNTFVDGWFASTASAGFKGLALTRSSQNVFDVPQFANNSDAGYGQDAESNGNLFNMPLFDGNCTLGGVAEMYCVGGFDGLQIIGGRAGYQGSNGITPVRALYLDTGASQNITVLGFNVPAGSVVNNSTGAKQTWLGVNGVPNRLDTAGLANAANDAAAAAAGVPVGGWYRNGSVMMIRVA